MIILVLVAGKDAKLATAHHLQNRVIGIAARIIQLPGEAFRQAKFRVPFPEDQQARVRGEVLLDGLHANRFPEKKPNDNCQTPCTIIASLQASKEVGDLQPLRRSWTLKNTILHE
ncbi:MAG: hypothetical protein KJ000_08155 [Pirellulaceae bacterium]|nr:hypothetical protein [Pirellulaceae bacterium]